MKRFSSFLIFFSLFLPVLPARAAMFSPGDLVKIASRPDVYYVGANSKRYVFPNEKTYFTWYADFSSAKTITDAELASLTVGGAVTHKPGVQLVKVTTDPKVYAVAKGGVLRWVMTEAVAQSLYGVDWAKKVHDLPDAYFATYTIGANIASSSDYSPSAETAAATSISTDKTVVTPTPTPTPVQTGVVSIMSSKASVQGGDVVTLTATATHATGITKIDIFFNSQLVKTCPSAMCVGDAVVPTSGQLSSYEAKAVATALDATQLTATLNLPSIATNSSLVSLLVARPQIRTGQIGEAIVQSDTSINVIRTDVYQDGSSIRACAASEHDCRYSATLSGAVGTTFDFYGKVTDSLGRTYTTPHKTITIATNDSPIVTVTPAKSLIYKGETLDVTVSATDDDGIASIDVLKDGAVLKACTGPSPCTITTGPWNAAGTLSFQGRATDGLGLSVTNGTVSVTVQ